MPSPNPAALDFLATRRSVPPKLLRAPAPEGAELDALLTIALRVPDHGKLEPWRLVVLGRSALDRLRPAMESWLEAQGADEANRAKALSALDSPLIVAVVSAVGATDRIPEREQLLSSGAVCLMLLEAALAAGWGAAWLTGWPAHDGFARAHLGLGDAESIVGVIHIGSFDGTVPDRPRPDLTQKVTYL